MLATLMNDEGAVLELWMGSGIIDEGENERGTV